MIKKIAFVGFGGPNRDVDKAKHFWGDLLGLKLTMEHEHEGKRWIEFDAPDGKTIALDGFSPDDQCYLSLETDGIEAEVEHLRGSGVEIVTEIMDHKVCKMCIIRDPEGHAIMLHQMAPERIAAGGKPPAAC